MRWPFHVASNGPEGIHELPSKPHCKSAKSNPMLRYFGSDGVRFEAILESTSETYIGLEGVDLSGYLILTGGTGLLGRYLIKDLLEAGQRLAVIVRGSRRESAAHRIEAVLQVWERQLGRSLPRPVVLEGDLRQDRLGLTESQIRWIARHGSAMIHSAASLKFESDAEGEPYRTNVDGTRHVLSLCRAAHLNQLHYVSTAYVCGLRSGTIYETELDEGQSFRNDYERSKLQAETMLRQASDSDKIQLTVYRPAVISGDATTGFTNTYHGIYLYLRLMALIAPQHPIGADGKRHTPVRIPMLGDEPRNVVPIDWVSRVMTRLLLSPQAHGNTYHLAPDHRLTPREVMDAGCSYYGTTGITYVGQQPIDSDTFNAIEAVVFANAGMYTAYETTDPLFDCSHTKRFAADLACPRIDEAMLHAYLKYGEDDVWGKRKANSLEYDSRAQRALQIRSEWDSEWDANSTARFGLECIGPGGGQWTFGLAGDGRWRVCPGLSCDPRDVIRMESSNWETIEAEIRKRKEFNGGLHLLLDTSGDAASSGTSNVAHSTEVSVSSRR